MSKIEKSKFKDSQGRALTQGLFLEHKYDTKYAVYTLKDEDFEYEGHIYPSLKRLYLEFEDPIEYDFANEHLLNWNQWKRITGNALFSDLVEQWREELNLKIRSGALRGMSDAAYGKDNVQAYKYLLEKGWEKRGVGRPSKKAQDKEDALRDSIANDYKDDLERMRSIQ